MALCTFAYACTLSEEETFSGEQASTNLNGPNLNGSNQNGSNQNGSNQNGRPLLGFLVTGATLGEDDLTDLRVDKGELVAELNSVTRRGTELVGTELLAEVRDGQSVVTAPYKITAIQAESGNDPTGTGNTFLYTLKQWDGSTWVDGCPLDHNGERFAIPVAAEWDETGNRTDDSGKFTLACTSGTIAKCYRWGYRPWVTGYGDLVAMHWTCTRLARADWCGDGVSHTVDGTWINVWDILPSPGPIQYQETVPDMEFDSGWNTGGATCLSTARWAASGSVVTAECPSKLPAPGSGGTPCNNQAAALTVDSSTVMFKEMDIL